GRQFPKPCVFAVGPAKFDRDILALRVACLGEALSECCEQASVRLGRARMEKSDHRYRPLLPPRRERPRSRCAAAQRDELAAHHLRGHSITSSTGARTDDGISSPSTLAVLRLITSSYLVGACTGRSAGFSPLRMRST